MSVPPVDNTVFRGVDGQDIPVDGRNGKISVACGDSWHTAPEASKRSILQQISDDLKPCHYKTDTYKKPAYKIRKVMVVADTSLIADTTSALRAAQCDIVMIGAKLALPTSGTKESCR